MNPDKRDELYKNLIGSGKVSESEIGSIDDFKSAIKDEASARQFHENLINSGLFGADEIGSADDFYGSISSDFASAPVSDSASGVAGGVTEAAGEAPAGGSVFQRARAFGEQQMNKAKEAQKSAATPSVSTPTQPQATTKEEEKPLGPERFKKSMEMSTALNQQQQSIHDKLEAIRTNPFDEGHEDVMAPAREERRKEEYQQKVDGYLKNALMPVSQSQSAIHDAWLKADVRSANDWKFGRVISNEAARLRHHDMDVMTEDAWNNIPESVRERTIGNVAGVLRESYRLGYDESYDQAEKIVRGEVYKMMYDEAVRMRAPRSWAEYLLNKVNSNSIGSLLEGVARSKAGTVGDMLAEEQGMEQYRKDNWFGGLAGDVLSFGVEAAGLVGGAGAKLGAKVASKMLTRKFMENMTGKLVMSGVTGGLNLGIFNAIGEASTQFRHGGAMKEDGTIGDYSLGNVGESALHGLGTGVLIGPTGQLFGNAGTKMAKGIESTVGKAAARGAMGVGSAIAEGTIFVAPEMLKGELTLDDWLGSVALMGGFKVQGGLKSAPAHIMELSREGRAGFETRLRSMLERSSRPDYSLTKDEKLELAKAGYGDLAELVEGYKNTSADQRAAIEGRRPIVLEANENGEIPYNRFIELVEDKNVSEAARAKMYYYVTGHGLPMSTVMGSRIGEYADANGKVKGYVVQSFGKDNGVITSKTFKNKKDADMEVERINRQAELNGVAVGEQAYNNEGNRQRTWEACEVVANRKKVPHSSVVKMMERVQADPSKATEMEKRWSQEVQEVYDALPAGDYQNSAALMKSVGEKYGVDVNKALRKEPKRRSDAEQKALKEYTEALYADAMKEPQPYNERQIPESFQRGYDTDEQNRTDIAIEMAEGDSEEAKEAWKGVEQRIEDDADFAVAQIRETYEMMKHEGDGSVRPATIKGDGGQHEVYIKSGNIVTNADGTVDPEKSEQTIVVYDPVEGKKKQISPSDIIEFGEVTSADDNMASFEMQRQEMIKKATDAAKGVVTLEPGQQYTLPDGNVATVLAVDGESVTLQMPDGSQTSMPLAEVQRLADELMMADYEERHPKTSEEPSGEVEDTVVDGVPEAFVPEMELTLKDGRKVYVTTGERQSVAANGYVENPDGRFIEVFDPAAENSTDAYTHVPVDDVKSYVPAAEAESAVEAERQQAEPAGTVKEQPVEETPVQQEEVLEAEEQAPAIVDDNSVAMPMVEVTTGRGKSKKTERVPNWYTATPSRAQHYIYNELGFTPEVASEVVKANMTDIDKAIDSLRKKEPKPTANPVAYKEAHDTWESKLQTLKDHRRYWDEVREIRQGELTEELKKKEAERLANETAEQKAKRETFEAEQARRQAEAEEAERRRREEDEQKASGTYTAPVQMTETTEPIEGTKTSESQLDIAKRELADDAEAMEILNDNQPHTLEEVASIALRSGKGQIGIIPEDFYNHTGYSPKDAKAYSFILSNEGVTISHLGEIVEGEARNWNVPFDENDATAGLNAVLAVLGEVQTQGDINGYITNNRIRQAYEHHNKMLSREEDLWIEAHDGLTRAEYEEWERSIEEAAAALNGQNYDEYYNKLAESTLNEYDNTRSTTDDGRSQEASSGALQGQEGDAAADTRDGVRGVEEGGSREGSVAEQIASQEVNENPTEGQKEAGNYKKAHVRVDGFDVTIEKKKGSTRSGKDASGKEWSITMQNDYGYIRGTEGVDGDHIDLYLSDTPEQGDVFVVDQVDPKTGEFDEHKVMYGFPDMESARKAYLSNYEEGWQGLGAITPVSKEEFKKWIESSHRKTKPFSEYKSVETLGDVQVENMPTEEQRAVDELAAQLDDHNSAKNDRLIQQIADLNTEASERWLDENVRSQKVDGRKAPLTKVRKAINEQLDEVMSDMLGEDYVAVETPDEVAKAEMEIANGGKINLNRAQKRALETVSFLENQDYQQTVVSSADGAKILKKLDTLAKKLDGLANNPVKTFIGELSKALEAVPDGSKSEYATFVTDNGVKVTIRLADHNADVENFDNRNEDYGISIVISHDKKSGGIKGKAKGKARVDEFFYNDIKLRKTFGKPLADMVRAVEDALHTGEFVDPTGIAEKEVVNADRISFQKAYHGSGADFDRFDSSHMGEGEGAQAYGYGHYTTEVEGIGRTYAKQGGVSTYKGKDNYFYDENIPFEERLAAQNILAIMQDGYTYEDALEIARNRKSRRIETLKRNKDKVQEDKYNQELEQQQKELDAYGNLSKEDFKVGKPILYTVEIPDDNGSNYLEWDKRISKEKRKRIADEVRKQDFGKRDVLFETLPRSQRKLIADKVRELPEDALDREHHGPNWMRGGINQLADMIEKNELSKNEIFDKLADAFFSQTKALDFIESIELATNYAEILAEKLESSIYTGANIVTELSDIVGAKRASEILHSAGFTGIKYPAQYRSGGREDNAKNYVIFDDNDLKITDKVKFFRTADGTAYGFTKDGKIYIDKRIATPETRIHEYAHLWAQGLKKRNPVAWKQLKSEMEKQADVMAKVKELYPELIDEKNPDHLTDEMMEEVFAHYSGKRGAERLEKDMREEMAKADGIIEKAKVANVFHKIREMLSKFWNMARDLFAGKVEGIEKLSGEDFADMMLGDLLRGFDPRAVRSEREEKTLMGVHNISEEKLRKALKQGGFANPSMAVIDTKHHMHNDYGEISLIPKSSLIDARTGKNAGTFTADAWTPSYPQTRLRPTNNGVSKFYKDLQDIDDKVSSELGSKLRLYFDSYLDGRDPDSMYWWYLYERGKNPNVATYGNVFGKEITDKVMGVLDNGKKSIFDLSKEEMEQLVNTYHDYKRKKGEEVVPAEERIAKMQQRLNSQTGDDPKLQPVRDRIRKNIEEIEQYGEFLSNLDNFVEGVQNTLRRENELDHYTTFSDARKRVENEGLKNDFNKWLEEINDRYGIESYVFNGYDYYGNQKWVKNTLKNVSKLMKQEGLNGATGVSGIGNWIARVAKKVKTLDQIRAEKDNLKATQEEHDAFRSKWADILYDISRKLDENDTFVGDNRMSEALDHANPADYIKQEYGIDLPKKDREAIDTFIKEVRENFPTGYFETKFERPVALDEFAVAVVPEGTSQDVVDALKAAGLDVRTYDGTSENRQAVTLDAVRGRDDIMFQKATSIEEVKDEVLREFKLSQNEENGDGRRIFIGKITDDGRSYLEKMFGVKIKPQTSFILNSSDLRHIYNDHYGNNEKDKGNNIPLTDEDIRNIVDVITSPDKIVFGIDKKEGRKMFFFFKNNNNGTYNLTEVYANSRGNLTTKSYLKTKRTISQRIDDLFKSPTLTSVTGGASSFQDAKIPTLFETAKNNLQNAENNGVRYQKLGTYTTKDGVQLSMMSLFEGTENLNDNANLNDKGDLTALRLRKLEPGETCHVERRYEENKSFSFMGKERIESMDDVAYIFKQLENAAVENSFVVLVKDGKPTIIHTGMGGYNYAPVEIRQAMAAYESLKPEKVYFVHNHPSGTLRASADDRKTLQDMSVIFGDEVVQDGIIIDTASGKYGIFGYDAEERDMPESADGEVPMKVYEFSKQVFSEGWKPKEALKIVDSKGIAEFISSQRCGEHPKMSFIIVNNQLQVVGNLFLPWTKLSDIKDMDAACRELSGNINLAGGMKGIIYGNYQYDKKDKRLLQQLTAGMKAMQTPLLDVVHVDINDVAGYHSAHDAGVMEPEEVYVTPKREAGEDIFDYAKRIADDYSAYEAIKAAQDAVRGNGALYAHEPETEGIWNDKNLTLDERITANLTRLALLHKNDDELKNRAYRAIGGNIANLRKAMFIQKEFDKTTVKRVADLARVLLSAGYLEDMSRNEISRLLSAVKNSTGHTDISGDIRKVMDIMVDSQLRRAESLLKDFESIKASKVDSKGVEVQGELDIAGQQIVKTFKQTRGMSEEEIGDSMAEAQERMGSDDAAVAEEAANEYAGLQMALEYRQGIHGSKVEERELNQQLDDARHATDRNPEYEQTLEEAIRQNRVERLQAYHDLMSRLGERLNESIENAQAFKDAEKARVREIQHNANSDMEGRPSDEHYKPEWRDKFVNNSAVQFFFAPLATFDQMLRLMGSKSANGEGYLYNRFMRGWVNARQKEIRGVREKYAQLDAKVKELFGKPSEENKGTANSMADLIRLIGKMPKAVVLFKDGGELKEHTLTQGNLMYIYMVNQMLDGRMKLRNMGIDEKKVAEVERMLDPRLMELADWMQEEFLVDTRNEYNETHKRLFGAPMAAIEHYFPLKILANARVDKTEDLDNPNMNEGISTKTGSIIKRRMNALPLDITNADALNVILDHVAQMEHWNAFAEFNRDLNTLRTYKHFRNQVKNMRTVYGSGDKLWQKFNDVCQMAAGTYKPQRANLDVAATNIAKGVTAAKVSFRVFTALKQFLSSPAYLSEARPDLLAKNLAMPWKAWSWAMENLPIFEERWKSRIAGDPRLMKSELDWKGWRNNVVQMASRIGMSPNAFVDALTVSIGAHAIYETKKARYLKDGYSEEQAEQRAKQDAEVAYNQTQQSSEGPFTSTMQVDRSWLSVMFTVFRNASMAYQRQLHDAVRNMKRNLTPEQREKSVEFMAKQLEREGVDEEQAQESAKRMFNRQLGKDAVRIAVFGAVMQFAWNLGAYLPYLLFGDDDDEKQKMWDDVITHSMFGWQEGFTGGDVLSGAGNMVLSGEGNAENLVKEMPVMSDIKDILKKIKKGDMGEIINDMVNLTVQAGVGVNPQSITDAVLAIMDACGDDPALAHETAIAVMRILQVPQSQIKKMYFDELGLSGEEVSQYTPAQLARRYAEYQVKRGHMLTPWNWSDEALIDKKQDAAMKTIKEKIGGSGDEEVNEAYKGYSDAAKSYGEQLKELRSKQEYKDGNAIEKAEMLSEYNSEHADEYAVYATFESMDKVLNKMVGYYLGAKTTKEAQLCRKAMDDYKKQMVSVMGAQSEEEKKAERDKLADMIETFYKEYGNLQSTRSKEEKVEKEMWMMLDGIEDAEAAAEEVKDENN